MALYDPEFELEYYTILQIQYEYSNLFIKSVYY